MQLPADDISVVPDGDGVAVTPRLSDQLADCQALKIDAPTMYDPPRSGVYAAHSMSSAGKGAP